MLVSSPWQPGHFLRSLRYARHTPQFMPHGAINPDSSVIISLLSLHDCGTDFRPRCLMLAWSVYQKAAAQSCAILDGAAVTYGGAESLYRLTLGTPHLSPHFHSCGREDRVQCCVPGICREHDRHLSVASSELPKVTPRAVAMACAGACAATILASSEQPGLRLTHRACGAVHSPQMCCRG